jgi:hypothetical protein
MNTRVLIGLMAGGLVFPCVAENPNGFQVQQYDYRGYGVTEYRYNNGRINRAEVKPGVGFRYNLRENSEKISSAQNQSQQNEGMDVPMFEVFRW